MDHSEELASDPDVAPHLDQICSFLSSCATSSSSSFSFSPASVRRAYGVVRTNAFGFSTRRGGEGAALFARVSLMSHSCK